MITSVCEQGVRNGGIAPSGQAPTDMKSNIVRATGRVDFDGYLSKGYLVHAGNIEDQTLAERQTRVAPAFSILAIGGGFIHGAAVSVTLQP